MQRSAPWKASCQTGSLHICHRRAGRYILILRDRRYIFRRLRASKHALHSNCAESVWYSGELHPRPDGGWDNFNDDILDDQVDWELVIDNNSGTYSPDKDLLPILKALLENNFPGFTIHALDHMDPELKRSREACRSYALKHCGVKRHELQPHAVEGEETLAHYVSIKAAS